MQDSRPDPVTYRERCRSLEAKVRALETQLRRREEQLARKRPPGWTLADVAGECPECGARDGDDCMTANGLPLPMGTGNRGAHVYRHHLRGRRLPCSARCSRCVGHFDLEAAE